MIRRLLRLSLIAMAAVALAACGFHLRRGAQLPEGMQRIHLSVSGHGAFPRELARALEVSGAKLEDAPGPGIAELEVPVAQFRTDRLTFTGFARVGEYAVRYHVEMQARDAAGRTIVPRQHIDMSREYTYDARQTIGNETQVEEIQDSLIRDMVQAILFRLQAAADHPVPASAASTAPAPAPAGSASAAPAPAGSASAVPVVGEG